MKEKGRKRAQSERKRATGISESNLVCMFVCVYVAFQLHNIFKALPLACAGIR